jgi:hypothetical protein
LKNALAYPYAGAIVVTSEVAELVLDKSGSVFGACFRFFRCDKDFFDVACVNKSEGDENCIVLESCSWERTKYKKVTWGQYFKKDWRQVVDTFTVKK